MTGFYQKGVFRLSGDLMLEFAEESDALFVPQLTDWDCGLASFRTCFRKYFGVSRDLSHKGWRRLLRTVDARWNDYGIPFPALARVGWVLDMNPKIFLGPSYLPRIENHIIANSFDKRQAFCRKEFQFSLDLASDCGVKVIFYKRQSSVVKAIKKCMIECPALIMEVHCKDAYGIDYEDWSHYWAIIKKENRWMLIDPYIIKGEEDFGIEKWRSYLQYSKNFNFKAWTGGFIAFHA